MNGDNEIINDDIVRNEEPIMREPKFWMVYIEGRNAPTKRHRNYDEAKAEAERLLHLPENRFNRAYILEAVSWGAVEAPPVVWRWTTPAGCIA